MGEGADARFEGGSFLGRVLADGRRGRGYAASAGEPMLVLAARDNPSFGGIPPDACAAAAIARGARDGARFSDGALRYLGLARGAGGTARVAQRAPPALMGARHAASTGRSLFSRGGYPPTSRPGGVSV